MVHYERLSALDALFLDLEKDASSHMHVAAVLLFDAAPLRAAHGGLDMARIRAYLESRLHLIPRYRQRLAYIPLERHPVWVDDARFNLFYHVRHTALPQPGEERQLKRLCGRIMSQKLDPTKPLWEVWVVEGLADDRFALIAKTHHAMAR
jgi:WS/DGAT/MGAT family acyltransferase